MISYPTHLSHFYKNKNVLVTGGAGFIGSHIAEALVLFGANVSIFDNLSHGSLKNCDQIKESISFIKGDITDQESCKAACQNIDIIFHCAALTSVIESEKNHEEYLQTNIEGTRILLEKAVENNVTSIIFSSSASVYGNHEGPCSELSPVNPQSWYALTKLMGEIYMKYFGHNFDIEPVILRYFNVYGPRQKSGVAAYFTQSLESNMPIKIVGDGLQTRDFVHVEEVVRTNLFAAAHAQELKGQCINVASGKNITILDLYQLLKQKNPLSTSEIIFLPPNAAEIRHSLADCTKLNTLLNRFE